jgi:hypothetical protein
VVLVTSKIMSVSSALDAEMEETTALPNRPTFPVPMKWWWWYY